LAGDAGGYVAAAMKIADTGKLPPVWVQPHGFPLLMAPLAWVAGPHMPEAMRAIQVAMDLAVLALLLKLCWLMLPGDRWRTPRALCSCAILLQPFTAMFAFSIHTETTVMFFTFVGSWLLAKYADSLRLSALAAGTWALSITALCRTELAVFPFVLGGLAVLLARSNSAERTASISKATFVIGSVFTLVYCGFLALQYASSRDLGIIEPRFYAAGYMRWLRTWAYSERDTERFAFSIMKPEGEWERIESYPPRAFDGKAERQAVRGLLSKLRHGYDTGADTAFSELAQRRAHANPVRTYLLLPLARGCLYWVNLQGAQTYLRAVRLPRMLSRCVVAGVMLLKGLIFFLAAVAVHRLVLARKSSSNWVTALGVLSLAVVLLRTLQLMLLGIVAWAGLAESRFVVLAYPSLLVLSIIGFAHLTEVYTFSPLGWRGQARPSRMAACGSIRDGLSRRLAQG
jgi:hypothetical protein